MSSGKGRTLLMGALLVTSCADFKSHSARSIASNRGVDLYSIFSGLEADVKRGTDSSLVCAEGLKGHYHKLLAIKGSDVEIEKYTSSELEDLIETSFLTRLGIMEKLEALQIRNKNDEACLGSVQDVIRALRYGEDYLSEVLVSRLGPKKLSEKYYTLKGESPYLLVNPKFDFNGPKDLRPGDIILSRGNAYSSAAIARIGSNDTQFSHLSFVYEDENGELHTTEAHIEVGNLVAPIQTHLDQGNARTVVFRYQDARIAKRASELIYRKVKKAQDSGRNIQYDFAMDLKDNQKLFCSEVIYDGFQMASGGKISVPRFRTKFSRGSLPFIQVLGIAVNESNIDKFETFAPGDMQFDSRFSLVAEWRDPSKMRDNRQKDAVLTMIFKWMEEESYRLRPAMSMGLKAQIAWLGRRLPIVKSKLEEQFPLNMTTDQLKLFFVLDEVAEPMQNYLIDIQEKKKSPLTPLEMYQALEAFKQADAKNYALWLRYKSELRDLERDRESDHFQKSKLRKLIKKHTPIFHERFHR